MNDPSIKNPYAPIIEQSEGMWMKYITVLLHKLKGSGVSEFITVEDLKNLQEEFDNKGDTAFLMIFGHYDSVEFRVIGEKEAEALEQYHKSSQITRPQ